MTKLDDELIHVWESATSIEAHDELTLSNRDRIAELEIRMRRLEKRVEQIYRTIDERSV